jgi:DNA-binding CsgD family transcriptional regulator
MPLSGEVAKLTAEQGPPIVGREAELAALDGFLAADAPQALLLTGGPGIGKTTLWEAGAALARDRGIRVLSARASGAETQLAFAALTDLLDAVGDEELAVLPPPQRQALAVALLRAESTGTPPPRAAISVGFLNALRAIAAQEPLLVAIDDVQWLDPASAEAVAFAAPRLGGQPVRFLLAKRSRTASVLERAHGTNGLERLEVHPLSLGATQRLLSERLGLKLPRHVLRRVLESTLGNPLFTLELGRTLAERGPLGIGEDVPLPDTVEELLGTRVATLPPPVRRLVLAVALSGDLRTTGVARIAPPGTLDEAVERGVLTVDGDRVRPAHPLFATAAKRNARASEQRELHLALAPLAGDPESRAMHLALAADQPDEELAAVVAAAAAGAAARGARRDAVALAEHALRLTPADSPARDERLLALAAHFEAAGDGQGITNVLAGTLESLPPGAPRVQALLLLTNSVVESNHEIRGYLARALAESGDDATLRASVLLEIAENDAVIRVEGMPTAEARALEALPAARAGDFERRALYVLGWPRALRGRSIDDLCEQFESISDAAWNVGTSPHRVAGQRLVWRGDVGRARVLLTELLGVADQRGESYSYMLQRLHMCQLELRVGNCEAVAQLLDEWAQSSERMMWPMYERCRALLGAARGQPDEAERWAAEALERAQATGTGWDRLEALRARGTGALAAHDPARAAESLREVWEHTLREGVDEPGVFPVAPDLIEALVELGELDEARAVVERLRMRAHEQEAHPWALATAKRGDALLRLASDAGSDEAATDLADAAADYGALDLRIDRARSLLNLGRAQRRQRKWGAARETFDEAAAAFDELGSTGWAEHARAEHGQVGGRGPQTTGELTPTEQRVAELAADGLGNKEIAQSLHVSVRTVEVHLKHTYAKLGVRSRSQLARRLSEPGVAAENPV